MCNVTIPPVRAARRSCNGTNGTEMREDLFIYMHMYIYIIYPHIYIYIYICTCIRRKSYIQGGKNAEGALSCKSFFAKEPLIIGFFCGK